MSGEGINILIALVAVGVALAGIRPGSTGALARRPGGGSGADTASLRSAGAVLGTLLVPGICAGQLPPDIMTDK